MDPVVRPVRYHTQWGYRFPGVLWWVALVIIPILCAALGSALNRRSIESDLTRRSVTALQDAGLANIHVRFEVRDASLDVPFGLTVSDADLARAEKILQGLDGVRIVKTPNTPQGAAPAAISPKKVSR